MPSPSPKSPTNTETLHEDHTHRYRGQLPAPELRIGHSPAWYSETIDRWLAERKAISEEKVDDQGLEQRNCAVEGLDRSVGQAE